MRPSSVARRPRGATVVEHLAAHGINRVCGGSGDRQQHRRTLGLVAELTPPWHAERQPHRAHRETALCRGRRTNERVIEYKPASGPRRTNSQLHPVAKCVFLSVCPRLAWFQFSIHQPTDRPIASFHDSSRNGFHTYTAVQSVTIYHHMAFSSAGIVRSCLCPLK